MGGGGNHFDLREAFIKVPSWWSGKEVRRLRRIATRRVSEALPAKIFAYASGLGNNVTLCPDR